MKGILLNTVKQLASVITDPWILFGFLILGIVFYIQNRRISRMQKMIIGQKLSSAVELTISQVLMGIFAGIVASLALSFIGVTFSENSSIYLVFFISIILVFLNPKYICFSYSGAIVGLISILAGLLSNVYHISTENYIIDITSLMTLVGVFHVIEGILIMVDGRRGVIPVFTNKDGKISGGFAFKRYWALPVIILMLTLDKSGASQTVNIDLPSWWPLIGTSLAKSVFNNSMLVVMPILGAIGYSSVTFSQSKMRKTITSGMLNIIYGVLISFIAQIARMGIVFQLIVVILVPLMHQLMIMLSNFYEKKLPAKYISDDEGISVLDVAPFSPAYEMGIKSGDKIVELNGEKVESETALADISEKLLNKVSIKVKKSSGIIKELCYDKLSQKSLGIIFVPLKVPEESIVVKLNDRSFKDVVNNMIDKKNNIHNLNADDNENNKANEEGSSEQSDENKDNEDIESKDNLENQDKNTDSDDKNHDNMDDSNKESK